MAVDPKGARMVDAMPFAMPSRFDAVAPHRTQAPAETWATEACRGSAPLSRQTLESENAKLRANVGARRATHERLVLQAEALRRCNDPSGREDADTSRIAALLFGARRELNSHRLQRLALEADVARCSQRLHHCASVGEKYQRDLAKLQEDYAAQVRNGREAKARRDEVREELNDERQEQEDLTRKAKTEQLRAAMLRHAFAQEQTRLGVSLGRAEAFVGDLVAATEGTRSMDVEEQALARACGVALRELSAEEARHEAEVAVTSSQLRRELADAAAALAEGEAAATHEHAGTAASIRAAASYAKVEAERHTLLSDLADVRQQCRALAELTLRAGHDAETCRREGDSVRARCEAVSRDLRFLGLTHLGTIRGGRSASLALLRPRLYLEEKVGASLRVVEARLREELGDADCHHGYGNGWDVLDAQQLEQSASAASRLAEEFSGELAAARAALRIDGDVRVPQPRLAGQGTAASELQAAALQRQLGQSFAEEAFLQWQLNQEVVGSLSKARQLEDARKRGAPQAVEPQRLHARLEAIRAALDYQALVR